MKYKYKKKLNDPYIPKGGKVESEGGDLEEEEREGEGEGKGEDEDEALGGFLFFYSVMVAIED